MEKSTARRRQANRKTMRMRISRLFVITAIAAATLLTASCDDTPDGVIPHDEMVSLMADIHTAESVVDIERRSFRSDSMRQVFKQSVLAAHGYDVAQFDSSLSYYGRNIDLYANLYDDVIALLEKRVAATEADAATDGSAASFAGGGIDLDVDGDSVDVWGLPRMLAFSRTSPVKMVPFGLTANRYWEKGDAYTLRGYVTNSSEPITMAMAVEYMDGSVDHLTVRVMGDGWKHFTLATDTARTARYIYGTIACESKPRAREIPVMIDSLTLFRTRFEPGRFRDPRTRSVGAVSAF